jgi:hypothetical protein
MGEGLLSYGRIVTGRGVNDKRNHRLPSLALYVSKSGRFGPPDNTLLLTGLPSGDREVERFRRSRPKSGHPNVPLFKTDSAGGNAV